MATAWTALAPLRFDPYLNWYARLAALAPPPSQAPWCLVRLLLPEKRGRQALAEFLAALRAGRMPDDPPGKTVTLTASEDEIGYVQQLVDDPDGDLSAPTMRTFHVYRPESLVHQDGGFRPSEYYTILHAGPPISGTCFGKKPTAPSGFDAPPKPVPAAGGVAIGIIDDGIGFANARFSDRNGRARIQRIWLQDIGEPLGTGSVSVGRVLTNTDIDALRDRHGDDERAIYAEVAGARQNRPDHKPLAFRRSHGTFCLDVATGAEAGEGPENRPIFAVQLPADAVADASGATVGAYILQGVRQIIRWVDAHQPGMPLVINFSYGLLAGPKDGTHAIELALDAMLDLRRARGAPTEMVLAAGNSFAARTKAAFMLAAGKSAAIDWVILPDDGTVNFAELWFDGQSDAVEWSQASVTLAPPDGGPGQSLALTTGQDQVLMADGVPIAMMSARMGLGATGKRVRVVLAVGATTFRKECCPAAAPHGRWIITLTNGTKDVLEARLYVQRDNTPAGYPERGRQSRFDHPGGHGRNPATGNYNDAGKGPLGEGDTLSAIATGPGLIVTGAAATVPVGGGFAPAHYTASGPSMGRKQPDYSAFADIGVKNSGILASGTFSGSVVAMNGTSVAAPQVVRMLAEQLGGVLTPSAPGVIKVPSAFQPRLGKNLLRPDHRAMRNSGRYG
ncbi:MAG: S8 family serine peptidase [Proteobacteria bacterium]|nr:S8 family serine peptidase [Pseudomonadota bacterium]